MRVVRAAAQIARKPVLKRKPRGQHRARALEPGSLDELRTPLETDPTHGGRGQRPVREAKVVVRVMNRREPLVWWVVDRRVQLLLGRDATPEQVIVQVDKLAHAKTVRRWPRFERVLCVVDERQPAAERPHDESFCGFLTAIVFAPLPFVREFKWQPEDEGTAVGPPACGPVVPPVPCPPHAPGSTRRDPKPARRLLPPAPRPAWPAHPRHARARRAARERACTPARRLAPCSAVARLMRFLHRRVRWCARAHAARCGALVRLDRAQARALAVRLAHKGLLRPADDARHRGGAQPPRGPVLQVR